MSFCICHFASICHSWDFWEWGWDWGTGMRHKPVIQMPVPHKSKQYKVPQGQGLEFVQSFLLCFSISFCVFFFLIFVVPHDIVDCRNFASKKIETMLHWGLDMFVYFLILLNIFRCFCYTLFDFSDVKLIGRRPPLISYQFYINKNEKCQKAPKNI